MLWSWHNEAITVRHLNCTRKGTNIIEIIVADAIGKKEESECAIHFLTVYK